MSRDIRQDPSGSTRTINNEGDYTMEPWMNGLLILIIFLSTGCTLTAIPYLTRRTESFGITVTAEVYHNSNLNNMHNNYTIIVGILTFMITVSMLVISRNTNYEETFALALSGHLVFMLVASFVIYIRYHLRMKSMKQ